MRFLLFRRKPCLTSWKKVKHHIRIDSCPYTCVRVRTHACESVCARVSLYARAHESLHDSVHAHASPYARVRFCTCACDSVRMRVRPRMCASPYASVRVRTRASRRDGRLTNDWWTTDCSRTGRHLNTVESRNSRPKSSGKSHYSGFWFRSLTLFFFFFIYSQ